MRRHVICVVCLLLVACESPRDYIKATAEFAIASNMVATAYRDELWRMHTLEADSHLRTARLNPREFAELPTLRDTRTFEPAALQIRLDAVDSLVRYSDLLSRAAGESLGAGFAASVQALKTSIDGVGQRLSDLSGKPDIGPDLSKASGLFAAVSANLGQAIIEQQQAEAIRQAVVDAEPDVSHIIALMRMDLKFLAELQGAKADELLKDAVVAYNMRVEKHRNSIPRSNFPGKEHERTHALLKEQYEHFKRGTIALRELGGALAALDAANQALARAAQTTDQHVKTAEILAAVQLLRMRAMAVLDAWAALKQ